MCEKVCMYFFPVKLDEDKIASFLNFSGVFQALSGLSLGMHNEGVKGLFLFIICLQ